jgi:hypothetical protein
MALSALPWVVLAFIALWEDPRPRRAAIAALGLAASLLFHTVSTLTFVPLILALLVVLFIGDALKVRRAGRGLRAAIRSPAAGWSVVAVAVAGLLACIFIVPMLLERGATVRVFDPQGRTHAEALLPGVVWCDSTLEAITGADVMTVITEWNEFRALDLETAKSKMAGDVIVDLRNIFQPDAARAAGFQYTGIGRR